MLEKQRYPYIVAWGRHMGSYSHYINDQVQYAIESNAPRTAIYRNFRSDGSGWDGTWSTVEEIRDERLRNWIQLTGDAL